MHQTQQSLFHETLADAIGSAIAAGGGFKKVAAALWPAMKTDSAYARLKACLDESKAEKLTTDEIVEVARIGRQKGDHSVMTYLAAELGYSVSALEPRDQLAELQHEYIEAARTIQRIAERIERAQVRAVG